MNSSFHDASSAPARVRRADRSQVLMRCESLDGLLPPDHQARSVWAMVGKLDLAAFYEPILARGDVAGRPATDPRLLTALWLFAAVEGVGSGRALAQLCEEHAAYRWLCGGVEMNYHTLNDFRVGHEKALDALFTSVLAALVKSGVASVDRIAQDGTRVRASAGTSSFRSRQGLEKLLQAAKEHVENLKKQNDPQVAQKAAASREREAQDRLSRIEAALVEVGKIEEARKKSGKSNSGRSKPRASTTDPEARRMMMANGGFNPAYNVQLAADTGSRAIVGVGVTNAGKDSGLGKTMREEIEKKTGAKVREHLTDGGYADMDEVDGAASQGVKIYRPPPPVTGKEASRKDCHEPVAGDTEAKAAWRAEMGTEEAKAVYKLRGQTIETINADVKAHRGLDKLRVRGLGKVKSVVLWIALAYNLMHFGSTL